MFPLAADCRSWGCDFLGIDKWPALRLCGNLPMLHYSTPSKPTIYPRCKHLCPLMRNEFREVSKRWWKNKEGKRWKRKKAVAGRARWRWWQAQCSSVCQLKNITDSIQNNPLLILTIPVSFQCFLTLDFIWFALYFFQIHFLRVTWERTCWLMSYWYIFQLARNTWTSLPPGEPRKQTESERGAQTGSHVDSQLSLGFLGGC